MTENHPYQIITQISEFNQEVIEAVRKKYGARVAYKISKTSFFVDTEYGEMAVAGLKGHRTLSAYLLLQRFQAHQTSLPEPLRRKLDLRREGVFFHSSDVGECTRVFGIHLRDLLLREKAWCEFFGPRWRKLRKPE
jgi:hypothetical protein